MMKVWIILILSAAVHANYYSPSYSPLKTDYEWKYFDYVWKSQAHKNWSIENGAYDQKAITSIDVDKSIGKLF